MYWTGMCNDIFIFGSRDVFNDYCFVHTTHAYHTSQIRFKVRVVSFNAASALAAGGSKGIETSSTALSAAVPVMEVVGCTNDFGLGLVSWW